VVGKNGVGKSTFLDLLTGQIRPDKGERIPGVTTRIGYFTQENGDLNPNHRVIEEVKEIAEFITLSDGTQITASKFLDLFLFPPEKQYIYIQKLSGGEKKRLQLLKILVTNPNFLILDEPTNDFDIDTLNVLEDFLEKYTGCLVLVSHDRYFMDHLVDELFVFEGEGKITPFNGNYSDYRAQADGESDPELPLPKAGASTGTLAKVEEAVIETSSSKRKLSYKEKKEFEELGLQIEILEKEKEALAIDLNQPGPDQDKIVAAGQRLAELGKEIETKSVRWLELSEWMG
jgi:ATP-binding cassette subfamily F protein uup